MPGEQYMAEPEAAEPGRREEETEDTRKVRERLAQLEAEAVAAQEHTQFFKDQAYEAAHIARELLKAAQTLGLEPAVYHRLVQTTASVNRHFNPAVRISQDPSREAQRG